MPGGNPVLASAHDVDMDQGHSINPGIIDTSRLWGTANPGINAATNPGIMDTSRQWENSERRTVTLAPSAPQAKRVAVANPARDAAADARAYAADQVQKTKEAKHQLLTMQAQMENQRREREEPPSGNRQINNNSPKRTRWQPKTGAAKALIRDKKEAQNELTMKQDLEWKSLVRETWRLHTGLTRAKDFFNYDSVGDATSAQCDDGQTTPELNSKLYFGTGWADCVWNETLLNKYIEVLLQKRAQDEKSYGLPDVTNRYIFLLFHGELKAARAEWSRWQPCQRETVEEAHERAAEYNHQRQIRTVGFARKQTISDKFEARKQTTERMMKISLAKGDETTANSWQILHEVIETLDVGGMLSEEEEVMEVMVGKKKRMQTVHKISLCPWRLKKIVDYGEMIDETREAQMGNCAPGQFRVRGEKRSECSPPLKLPCGMYDTDWLKQQKDFFPDIEEELEITEKEFRTVEVVAEMTARLALSDPIPGNPSSQTPAAHIVLAEAQNSMMAVVSEGLNLRTIVPTRQAQSNQLMSSLSSKIQTVVASIQSADHGSEKADSLWKKVDHAQHELEIVASSLQPLKDTPEKSRVVDEMRKLEHELKEFTSTLPKMSGLSITTQGTRWIIRSNIWMRWPKS
ncbi:hypothetical protein C8J57DRAFT_1514613 [Mycena rebaudengoi]|nr:hypothetical protein C8J57DRAFT_1514613 [Mycena rebaudengoi]